MDELLCGNSTIELLRGAGNAVAMVENYEKARALILECVRNLKKKGRVRGVWN